MRIDVNGQSRVVEDSLSLAQLVVSLNLKPEQIAIELNQSVVRRKHWPETMLNEDDRVEIVHFVGGGSEQEAGAVGRWQL